MPEPPARSSARNRTVVSRITGPIPAAVRSVISMPSWEIGPPNGPIEKGMTYMVRPA